jgi:hypothetical protein
MKKSILLISFLFLCGLYTQAQIKSPSEFLPNYGKQITFHYQMESYFNHLVKESSLIKHHVYGQTNEERNLNVYFVSTPENLANLDQIRNNNLSAIGLSNQTNQKIGDKLIVWISFSVHGNEYAGMESAMTVAYELLNPANKETKEWLKNTIVILDPCENPDGQSRYANWLREISGKKTHPGLSDREHMEVWPGGRYNHYVFDLNRDWAWQTQVESQKRIALYNQWMPQVHADIHEMGYESPYFFPPSAEPLHEFIDQYQKDFHFSLGKNIAAKFDKENWLYNTRERFDLFYPSYGDTYPTYNGAVGMTLEQGGIGAGREIKLANGTHLTTKDRLTHHAKAVLTIIETASNQSDQLLKGFRGFMTNSRKKAKGVYATYVMKNNPKSEQLVELLKKNGIEYSYANANQKTIGYNYKTKKDNAFSIEPNDLIIKADQARGVMTQVLFEPNQKLNDSLSYDITAWDLPLAYGLEGYALKNSLALSTKATIEKKLLNVPEKVYAFHIPWNNRTSAKIVSQLLQNGIKVRTAAQKAVFGDVIVESGGLIVSKGDNPTITNFEKTVGDLIQSKADYNYLTSGFSVNARDLGGENFSLIKMPKILLLSGKGVNPTEFGAVWHYLDEVIQYPTSIVDVSNLGRIDWSEYNTLILADGNYNFSEDFSKQLENWIAKGGKVIAMNEALSQFEKTESYALRVFASDEEKTKSENAAKEKELKSRLLDYHNHERRLISSSIPGAIIENSIDASHPLAFGLGSNYFSLKTDARKYSLLTNASNVIYVPKNYRSYGFIGHELKKELAETVTFAVEKKNKGTLIYMIDNPLFRGFWENGILLFSNALFQVQ